jgi:prepilin-type N-terminal cleavage/methylation domain-containing protein
MKTLRCLNNNAGFALIELLMVFVIIGALASIAIPHYVDYRVKALEAQCKANRYHIEMEEMAYFAEHGKPSLKINDKYSCPSGGTYVWLVMYPEDPHYPQIGCSIHFTGSAPETAAPKEEAPATPAPPVDETPPAPAPPTEEPAPAPEVPVITPEPTPEVPVITPTPPKEEVSPSQLIGDLIDYINHLDLSKSLNSSLISKLENAKTAIEKDKNNQAVTALNNFSKQVQTQETKGKIAPEEADMLISKAKEIMGYCNP